MPGVVGSQLDRLVQTSVPLSLARPALVSGAVMMWARALSEFGAVIVLAYYPMTAPVLIYDHRCLGAQAYIQLAAEFLRRFDGRRGNG